MFFRIASIVVTTTVAVASLSFAANATTPKKPPSRAAAGAHTWLSGSWACRSNDDSDAMRVAAAHDGAALLLTWRDAMRGSGGSARGDARDGVDVMEGERSGGSDGSQRVGAFRRSAPPAKRVALARRSDTGGSDFVSIRRRGTQEPAATRHCHRDGNAYAIVYERPATR